MRLSLVTLACMAFAGTMGLPPAALAQQKSAKGLPGGMALGQGLQSGQGNNGKSLRGGMPSGWTHGTAGGSAC
jgi:hypothetical protein